MTRTIAKEYVAKREELGHPVDENGGKMARTGSSDSRRDAAASDISSGCAD